MSSELPVPGPSRVIQNVSFRGDGVVEVTFAEASDMGDNVALIRVLMFDASLLDAEVAELLDTLSDLVDQAIDKLRNPPMTRPSGLLAR